MYHIQSSDFVLKNVTKCNIMLNIREVNSLKCHFGDHIPSQSWRSGSWVTGPIYPLTSTSGAIKWHRLGIPVLKHIRCRDHRHNCVNWPVFLQTGLVFKTIKWQQWRGDNVNLKIVCNFSFSFNKQTQRICKHRNWYLYVYMSKIFVSWVINLDHKLYTFPVRSTI